MSKSFFENLGAEENGHFKYRESSWWNGHAFFPCHDYQLVYKYLNQDIQIRYENKKSEFSKPSKVGLGLYSERHYTEFNFIIPFHDSLSEFSVTSSSFFQRFLDQKTVFRIKSKDKELISFIQNNKTLESIYRIVENSPEFDPEIKSEINKDQYIFNVRYGSQYFNKESVILFNNLCKELISYLNKRLNQKQGVLSF